VDRDDDDERKEIYIEKEKGGRESRSPSSVDSHVSSPIQIFFSFFSSFFEIKNVRGNVYNLKSI
jgi:hypothetical protein